MLSQAGKHGILNVMEKPEHTNFAYKLDQVVNNFNEKIVFNGNVNENKIGSGLSFWVNLAILTHMSNDLGVREEQFKQIVGVSKHDVESVLRELFGSKPESVLFGLGFWWKDPYDFRRLVDLVTKVDPYATVNSPIPSPQVLNQWVSDKTLGLIKKFPVKVDSDTAALLANFITTKVNWYTPFTVSEVENKWNVSKVLHDKDSSFTVGVTETGEPYFIHAKQGVKVNGSGDDGSRVVVYSATGSEKVSLEELYALTVEAHRGRLVSADEESVGRFLEASPDFVSVETVQRAQVFSKTVAEVFMPAWSAETVGRLDDVIEDQFKQAGVLGVDFPETTQSAYAKYNATGYEAAAVTVSRIRATGLPRVTTVKNLIVNYSRPFVSVSFPLVPEDSVWADVPLFTSVVRVAEEPES